MEKQGLDSFVAGLRIVMDERSLRPAPLSEAAGLGTSAIRDLFRKEASPKVSTARAIAAQLGMTIDEIIARGDLLGQTVANSRLVSVPGKVGAGAQVYAIDDHAKGEGLYRVICPPQLSPHGVVAVEVDGDSMLPVYAPGDVLFYTRDTVGVPTEALGRICVAEDDQGRTWVKQVKLSQEEGRFSLLSINPTGENMHGAVLRWAAPVRLHLPKDLVRKA